MVLRKITYSCLLSFLALAAKSQSYTGALRTLPSQDNAALRESARRKMEAGGPFEFGVTIPVGITPSTIGQWENLPRGGYVWRQKIRSAGAQSLNFHFSTFALSKGAFLLIWSKDRSTSIGPFYSRPGQTEFWTPLIESDEVELELQLPQGADTSGHGLYLNSVQHDFVGLGRIIAGTCNLDAVCGAKVSGGGDGGED